MTKATAIVVARGGSVRLPGKALLPFGDSTLIGHKVRTLLDCQRVGRVVVGSDSPDILTEAAWHGAEIVRRDDYHCDESRCSANEMVRDMIRRSGCSGRDRVLWAHPTNPLVKAETYDAALALDDERELALSVASVRVEHRHAWWVGGVPGGGVPLNHAPFADIHVPAAELIPVCYQDGAIFIRSAAAFLSDGRFVGRSPHLFPMPGWEWWDIDTAADYRAALALHSCALPSTPQARLSDSSAATTSR